MTELAVHVAVQDTAAGPCTVVELVGQADVSARAMSEALAAEVAKAPQLLVVTCPGSASSIPRRWA